MTFISSFRKTAAETIELGKSQYKYVESPKDMTSAGKVRTHGKMEQAWDKAKKGFRSAASSAADTARKAGKSKWVRYGVPAAGLGALAVYGMSEDHGQKA